MREKEIHTQDLVPPAPYGIPASERKNQLPRRALCTPRTRRYKLRLQARGHFHEAPPTRSGARSRSGEERPGRAHKLRGKVDSTESQRLKRVARGSSRHGTSGSESRADSIRPIDSVRPIESSAFCRRRRASTARGWKLVEDGSFTARGLSADADELPLRASASPPSASSAFFTSGKAVEAMNTPEDAFPQPSLRAKSNFFADDYEVYTRTF